MLAACLLFVLLGVFITLFISPVIIRYTKGESAALVVHFVFFSITLFKKEGKNEAEDKKTPKAGSKKKALGGSRAPIHALRYAIPRATVCAWSLPLPIEASPCFFGIGIGIYYSVISVLLSKFGSCTSDPMLITKKDDAPALDVRFRLRLYTFLHTFLIYLAQYRKEKEAKRSYVGNKNE